MANEKYYAVVSDFNVSTMPPVLLYVGELSEVAEYLLLMNRILFPKAIFPEVYEDLGDIMSTLNSKENNSHYRISLVTIPSSEISSTYNDLEDIRLFIQAHTTNMFQS